jgi:putative ABC transport system permease protein
VSGIRLLVRRSLRDLAAMRFRAAAIVLIVASGMAIFTGMYSAIDSLLATRDEWYRKGGMPDLEVRFVLEDQINLPSFADLPGVEAVESRLLLPGHVELKNGRHLSATLVGLDLAGPRRLGRLTLLAGRPLDSASPSEVLIDPNFARYHGFVPGDRILLMVGRDRFELTVRGIAVSPEYLIASANPSDLLPSKGSMAILFAPLQLVAERLGFRPVDSLVFRLGNVADRGALAARIAARADQKLTVEEMIPRSRQFASLFLAKDLRAFALFVPAIIVIFAVTSVLVTLFLMFQWIAGQRREIGLLMALGYGRARLVAAYLFPLVLLAALAVIAGGLLSTTTLAGFALSYADAIGLPRPRLFLDGGLIAWGAAGVALLLAVAGAVPQARLLAMSPQDAVRTARGRAAAGAVARRLGSWLGRTLWLRYALRNVLRNRIVSLMTAVSVGLALGVSISYEIAMASFEKTLVRHFAADRWDVAVDFLSPVWDDELGMLDTVRGITAVDPYLRGAVRLVAGRRVESSLVTGIEPGRSLHGEEVLEGRGIAPGDVDVILLERKLARDLGYRLGDEVTVDSRGRQFRARLVGTFSGSLPGASYAPRSAVQRWLDLDEQSSGVFLRTSMPPAGLRNQLFRLERVGGVTFKSELIGNLLAIVHEVLVILYITEAFSVLVAALFVFTSTSFTLLARREEYALLRILGFGDRTVAAMVVAEVSMVGLLGAALAIPVGYGLARLLCGRLSEAWFAVGTVFAPRDALIILVPALLVLPLTALPAVRTILAANLPQTLREKRFG